MSDVAIATFMGHSIGLGVLTSLITQLVKQAETIPGVNKIPGAQALIDMIDSGNVVQIRVFVGVIAVVLNVLNAVITTHALPPYATLMSTVGTVFAALGGYDMFFSGIKKKAE